MAVNTISRLRSFQIVDGLDKRLRGTWVEVLQVLHNQQVAVACLLQFRRPITNLISVLVLALGGEQRRLCGSHQVASCYHRDDEIGPVLEYLLCEGMHEVRLASASRPMQQQCPGALGKPSKRQAGIVSFRWSCIATPCAESLCSRWRVETRTALYLRRNVLDCNPGRSIFRGFKKAGEG